MGCPDQSRGSQPELSRGPTRRLSHFKFTPSHTGRSAGAMAVIPPGGQSSCGSTRLSTRSQLQGRQSNHGPTRWRPGMQRALIKFLQFVRSSDGHDFPWVAGPAADLRGGPPGNGNSQGRQHPRGSTRWRPICIKPSSSLAIRVGRPCDGLGDSSGRSAELQDAVGHPGSSSSDRRPAAAPRGGGLSEWPDHHGTAELAQTTRGHLGSSGGQLSCGTQCATRERQPPVQPRVYAVAVSPSGQLHSGLCGATRSCRMARVAAGMKRVRQVGELTLSSSGAQAPQRAGSTGIAQQVPTSVSRISSIRRAGSAAGLQPLLAGRGGRGIDAPGPDRRSRYSGGSSTSTAAARGPHEVANQVRRPRVPTAPAVSQTSPDLGGHPGSCDPIGTPHLQACVYARAKSASPLQSKKPCNLLQGSTLTTHERCSYSFSCLHDFIPEFFQGSPSKLSQHCHDHSCSICAANNNSLAPISLTRLLCNKHPNNRICDSELSRNSSTKFIGIYLTQHISPACGSFVVVI